MRLFKLDNMKYFTYLFIVFFVGLNAENIQLNIENGPIMGQTGYTIGLNKLWYTFKGIPYAEHPKRFELAILKKPWKDVIDCTHDKPQCVQGDDPVTGSEDCLTLSVYTPALNRSFPVIVWVHGGYFTAGNGSYVSQSPDYIVDEDVVFVQIQYRLGIFGFISTSDLDCPGNLGLKDQVLALQWVQRNIKYFGGDPNRVTLGGQSAGAAGVSLHLQSPKSKGLFHAMTLNSGSSLCLWSFSRRAKETAFGVGLSLGVFALSSKTLVNGLKKKGYEELQKASTFVSRMIMLRNPLAGLSYGYVSEPDHPDAFFTGKSEQLLSEGNFTKVPLLLGLNSNEANMFGNISWYINAYLFMYDFTNEQIVPADLTTDFWKRNAAGQKIKNQFFKNSLVAVNDGDIIDFASSDQFERPIWQFAKHVSKYVKQTYFYKFGYEGVLGGLLDRPYEGVGHAEDLNYLFYKKKDAVSDSDILMKNRTVKLWTNFFKTHDPTPEDDPLLENQRWLPMRNEENDVKYYFNINSTLNYMPEPIDENMDFWNNDVDGLYKTYGEGVYNSY